MYCLTCKNIILQSRVGNLWLSRNCWSPLAMISNLLKLKDKDYINDSPAARFPQLPHSRFRIRQWGLSEKKHSDSIFTFETHSLFLFLIYKYLWPDYDIAILTSTDRTELFRSDAVMQG